MSRKRSIAIGAGIGLVLVAALWLAVSPYVILHRMQRAVVAQDAQTVSGYIDFASLRESIKRQTTQQLTANAARKGRSPAALAIATAGTNKAIDTFVQPPLIAMMLADVRSPNNPIGGKIVGPEVKVHRTGLTSFQVTGSRAGAVIFEMRGLSWKLVGVERRSAP